MSWDHAEHLRHFPTPIPDAHDGDRAAPPPVTDALAVRFVADGGVVEAPVQEIPVLVKREDGFLWLDVPVWTSELDGLLAAELSLHPVAREYCRVRNHMP